MDGIDLVESFLHRELAHTVAINPDGKEDGVHAAFAHAGDVDVTHRITDDCRRRRIDVVVVWKFDRFARGGGWV